MFAELARSEIAFADVVIAHPARVHVTGHVIFLGERTPTTLVVERSDGSTASSVELTSSIDTYEAGRCFVSLCGDTPEALDPGAYRVRLLARREAPIVIARIGHVLLSSPPADQSV